MRRRREATLDPEMARELAALDAALRQEPVEADLAELEELVRVTRAQRPQPSDAFAERLDARVRAGFADGRRPPRIGAIRARMSQRMLLPALGAAATLLLGVVVATSVVSGGGTSKPVVREQSAPATVAAAGRGASTASKSFDTAQPAPAAVPAQAARKVEHRASLTLAAPADRIDEVSDQVVRTTDRFGGIVLSSSVSSGDVGQGGADFRLRIPSDRLSPALAALSKLAHVRSRNENAEDVTAEFNSTKGRLDEALAERNGLLRQLAAASTPNQAASIRARLRINGQEIAQARTALKSVRDRTSFSVVDLTVAPGSRQGGGLWTPDDALDDALRVLSVTLGVVLVALSVLLPLGVLGAAGALAGRGVRRRRREQALA